MRIVKNFATEMREMMGTTTKFAHNGSQTPENAEINVLISLRPVDQHVASVQEGLGLFREKAMIVIEKMMTETNRKTKKLVQIREQLAATMTENIADDIHVLGESENKLENGQLAIETHVNLRF